MTRTRTQRLSIAARLGGLGASLGVLAGAVQATVGTRIPDWSGNKDSPVGLGLLTIALSASVLAIAARAQRVSTVPRPETLAAITLWLVAVALLCSTTVGRLWVIPGTLIIAAAVFSFAACGWNGFRGVVASNWLSGLLGLLGVFEVLMAISAASLATVTAGVVAGGALITAATISRPGRRTIVTALVAATLPFVAVTWWTIVTPLVSVVALAIGLALAGGHVSSPDGETVAPLDVQPVG